MFSLQQLLGKDQRFFELMEGSAEEARASIQCLIGLIKHRDSAKSLEAFARIRKKDKRITQELTEHLCRTFVTPLEREDIEALSHALYKIPKSAEKFGERFLLAPKHVAGLKLAHQLEMLEKAAETISLMVKELRLGVNLQKVKKQNDQLQHIEAEADKLMIEALQDLYTGDHSGLHVVILKDLFELLEKVFDRCRDVGNLVFHIVLKHS